MINLQNIRTVVGDFTLDEIDFEVANGEYFVLLGPTGAGKTVLLETIAGLNRPERGRVLVESRDITDKPLHKRHLGMVFQRQCLFEHMRVCDNIGYALRIAGICREEISHRVEAIADELGVNKLLRQNPESLSGGERQRVALARTLIHQPKCLLLDEPLSAIDATGRADMRHLLKSLQHRHKLTVLHVTHDFEDALALADRMGVMNNGRLIEVGTAEQLFTRPGTHFVADFLGGGNILSGAIKPRGDVSIFITEHNEFSLPPQTIEGPGYLFIQSQDIVISRQPLKSSARNCVAGRVSDIKTQPAGTAMVEIDAGDFLRVMVLARTVAEMEIKEKEKVYLTFKSSGTHVISTEK